MSEKINFKDYNFDNLLVESEEFRENLDWREKFFDLIKGGSIKEVVNTFFLNTNSVPELMIFIHTYATIIESKPLKSLMELHRLIVKGKEFFPINSDPENSCFGEYTVGDDPQFEAAMLESFFKNMNVDENQKVNIIDIAKTMQNHSDPLISNWSTFVTVYLSTLI